MATDYQTAVLVPHRLGSWILSGAGGEYENLVSNEVRGAMPTEEQDRIGIQTFQFKDEKNQDSRSQPRFYLKTHLDRQICPRHGRFWPRGGVIWSHGRRIWPFHASDPCWLCWLQNIWGGLRSTCFCSILSLRPHCGHGSRSCPFGNSH